MCPHTETRVGSTRWLSMNEEIMRAPRGSPQRAPPSFQAAAPPGFQVQKTDGIDKISAVAGRQGEVNLRKLMN